MSEPFAAEIFISSFSSWIIKQKTLNPHMTLWRQSSLNRWFITNCSSCLKGLSNFYRLDQLSSKSHNWCPNTSLMVLTACNCVMRSSQANFVLNSCLAQVRFGPLLSGLCGPLRVLLLLVLDHLEPPPSDCRTGQGDAGGRRRADPDAAGWGGHRLNNWYIRKPLFRWTCQRVL